jgi:hypothetical protein
MACLIASRREVLVDADTDVACGRGCVADSLSGLLARIRLEKYVEVLEANDVDESNMHYLDMQTLESFGIGISAS